MHIVIGRFLKYFLWFSFCVILGALLFGFAKFGFQPGLYIQYLNGIEAQQFLNVGSINQTGAILSGVVTDVTGDEGIYDPTVEADIFGQTGTQISGNIATGTTNSESFGFIQNSDTTGKVVDTKPTSITTGTTSPSISTGDKMKNLLNLVKSREK